MSQFLVVDKATGKPVGLASAYNPDFENGFAYLAAVKFEENGLSTRFFMGFALFVDYLFAVWPFRKLYAESAEYNYRQFSSGADRYFVEEGRLREHRYYLGSYYDEIIVALYRETWIEQCGRVMNAIDRHNV